MGKEIKKEKNANMDKDVASAKKAFHSLTFRQKLQYALEYHKWSIFAAVAIIVILVLVCIKIQNPDPESILNVALVDVDLNVVTDDVFSRYLTENGYDEDTQTITVECMNTGVYTGQLLTAELLTGDVDLIAGGEEAIKNLAESGSFCDLSSVFSEEHLAEYGDRCCTVTDEDGNEVIYAIRLADENPLTEDGYYEGDVWIAISNTAANMDMAEIMFQYLLEN